MDSQKREILKAARKRKGLTQEQTAEKLKISREGYSKIERGVRNPKLSTAIKIADLFDVSVRDI